jgi:hypothetical protein
VFRRHDRNNTKFLQPLQRRRGQNYLGTLHCVPPPSPREHPHRQTVPAVALQCAPTR